MSDVITGDITIHTVGLYFLTYKHTTVFLVLVDKRRFTGIVWQ